MKSINNVNIETQLNKSTVHPLKWLPSLLVLLLGVVFFSACKGTENTPADKNGKLVGTWEISEVEFNTYLNGTKLTVEKNLAKDLVQGGPLAKAVSGTTWTFTPTGNLDVVSQLDGNNGKYSVDWKVNPPKIRIYGTNAKGEPWEQLMDIKSLTSESLSLSYSETVADKDSSTGVDTTIVGELVLIFKRVK